MKKLLVGPLAATVPAGCGRVAEEVAERATEEAIERGLEAEAGGTSTSNSLEETSPPS